MTRTERAGDPEAVVAGLEAMDVALFRGLAGVLDLEFVEAGDHAHVRCGVRGGGLNRVMAVRLPPDDLDGAVERIMAPFRQQSLPMHWSLWPTAQPADVGRHLERHGLTDGGERPGMAIDLARLPAAPAAPADVEIRPVTDAATRRLWFDVASAVFGFSPALAEAFQRGPARSEATEARPLTHVVALRAGAAVAVASVVAAGGVAGLGWVGTVPAARRQGIGAAVTLAALRLGRDCGCQTGGLWASPLGRGVYRRLGFEEVCPLRYYAWSPPAS